MGENSGDNFTAHVDRDLKEFIPEFIKHRRDEIRKMESLLKNNEFEAIKAIAHSMKGVGGGYGFDYITEAGAMLEEAAGKSDSATINEIMGKLLHYLDTVKILYD